MKAAVFILTCILSALPVEAATRSIWSSSDRIEGSGLEKRRAERAAACKHAADCARKEEPPSAPVAHDPRARDPRASDFCVNNSNARGCR